MSVRPNKRPRTHTHTEHLTYKPGSIVRITCRNFLTYTETTCHPGPSLNMIIGPNGTGKSTLACAIALGLGFKPRVLGRAEKLSSFVKEGASEGYVEVEVKGRAAQNLVVRRVFLSHEAHRSTFLLNGRLATYRAVSDAVAALDVHLSNLCTFLPQDRVVMFARMSPSELLHETERVYRVEARAGGGAGDAGDADDAGDASAHAGPSDSEVPQDLRENGRSNGSNGAPSQSANADTDPDTDADMSHDANPDISHEVEADADADADAEADDSSGLWGYHRSLIDKQALHDRESATLKDVAQRLHRAKERNAQLAKEVEALHERERILVRIEGLQLAAPRAEKRDTELHIAQLQEKERALEEAHRRERAAHAALLKAENAVSRIENRRKKDDVDLATQLKHMDYDCNMGQDTIRGKRDRQREAYQNLRNAEDQEKSRERRIAELQRDFEQKQRELADLPEPEAYDADAHAPEVRDLEAAEKKLRAQDAKLSQALSTAKVRKNRFMQQIDALEKQRRRLENTSSVRERHVRGARPRIWNAVQYLRRNADRLNLKAPVQEPGRLCISFNSARDARLVDVAEGAVASVALDTFLVRSRQDYTVLSDEMIARNNMRINVTECFPPFDESDADAVTEYIESHIPLPRHELAALGFEGYVIDLITAPPIMIYYLCEFHKLHCVPYAMDLVPDDAARRFAAANGGLASYMTPEWRIISQPQKYGRRDKRLVTTHPVTPSVIFKHDKDVEAIEATDAELKARRADFDAVDHETSDIAMRAANINAQLQTITQRLKEINDERNAVTGRASERNALVRLIANMQQRITKESSDTRGSTTVADLQRDLQGRATRLAGEACLTAASVVRFARSSVLRHPSVYVRASTAGEQASHIKGVAVAAREELGKIRLEREDIRESMADLQGKIASFDSVADKLLADLQDNPRRDAILDVAAAFEHASLVDITREQERLRNSIELSSSVSESVIHQYEQRQIAIRDLSVQHDTLVACLADIDTAVSTLHDMWRPRLEMLVAQIDDHFSGSFAKLGCRGQVALCTHESYARWGIEIRVAFRKNEPLQVLTAQRQSGGERSLATVMYLMALLSLVPTPFSLVDEINQGMDVRVERAVHNQLVQMTSSAALGQYFLITPKLLPNLEYSDSMRVLTVFNGDHLPGAPIDLRGVALRR